MYSAGIASLSKFAQRFSLDLDSPLCLARFQIAPQYGHREEWQRRLVDPFHCYALTENDEHRAVKEMVMV